MTHALDSDFPIKKNYMYMIFARFLTLCLRLSCLKLIQLCAHTNISLERNCTNKIQNIKSFDRQCYLVIRIREFYKYMRIVTNISTFTNE